MLARMQGRREATLIHGWSELVHQPQKLVWSYFNKLKIELPYDLAIPFLGIYPKECK
jgi:hypothetical protein